MASETAAWQQEQNFADTSAALAGNPTGDFFGLASVPQGYVHLGTPQLVDNTGNSIAATNANMSLGADASINPVAKLATSGTGVVANRGDPSWDALTPEQQGQIIVDANARAAAYNANSSQALAGAVMNSFSIYSNALLTGSKAGAAMALIPQGITYLAVSTIEKAAAAGDLASSAILTAMGGAGAALDTVHRSGLAGFTKDLGTSMMTSSPVSPPRIRYPMFLAGTALRLAGSISSSGASIAQYGLSNSEAALRNGEYLLRGGWSNQYLPGSY